MRHCSDNKCIILTPCKQANYSMQCQMSLCKLFKLRPQDSHRTANSTSMNHTSFQVSDSNIHSSKHLSLPSSLGVILNSLYTELKSKQTMTGRFKRWSVLSHSASTSVLFRTSSFPYLPSNECNLEFHLYQCSICLLTEAVHPSFPSKCYLNTVSSWGVRKGWDESNPAERLGSEHVGLEHL